MTIPQHIPRDLRSPAGERTGNSGNLQTASSPSRTCQAIVRIVENSQNTKICVDDLTIPYNSYLVSTSIVSNSFDDSESSLTIHC
ncbi:hypothetical protein [Microcoleus sp. D3_18_C2]|uniref:hypothetical protein n=1 Tax=Microcoleus sp. D3_18_C2 TaxID=3055334 RepID=UPI002FD6878F